MIAGTTLGALSSAVSSARWTKAVSARHHQVEDAQILEEESVARGHGRACHFRAGNHIEQKMNTSTNENPDASSPHLPWASGVAKLVAYELSVWK